MVTVINVTAKANYSSNPQENLIAWTQEKYLAAGDYVMGVRWD